MFPPDEQHIKARALQREAVTMHALVCDQVVDDGYDCPFQSGR